MIPAVHRWATNAELIYDAYQLGYVSDRVLDATPGERGLWWDRFEPGEIELTLNPGWDFTALPFGAETFDTVAYDPPYTLNGHPHGLPALSRRYGVDTPAIPARPAGLEPTLWRRYPRQVAGPHEADPRRCQGVCPHRQGRRAPAGQVPGSGRQRQDALADRRDHSTP